MPSQSLLMLTLLLAMAVAASAIDVRVTVRPNQVLGRVPRLLTGACIEDVNHEIYGGLYSQMVFGESFQEPSATGAPSGFVASSGRWAVTGGELAAPAGDGPRLLSDGPSFADGSVGVDVLLEDARDGNAGLIMRAQGTRPGADAFVGYEVSLDAAAQIVRIGRHQNNWVLLRDTPCAVPVGTWIRLSARLQGSNIEVSIDGRVVAACQDPGSSLAAGSVGLRTWQRSARYRDMWVRTGGRRTKLRFLSAQTGSDQVSSMWRGVRSSDAVGELSLCRDAPFVGGQCQRIAFSSGTGAIGVANRGLNNQGMHFVGGKPYEGTVWARSQSPAKLWVALEDASGALLAERALTIRPGAWRRLAFRLTPKETRGNGQLALMLRERGQVDLGYVALHPGARGRFRGLPVRGDVAQALVDQGTTVLRYGGSMVNHQEYRWKNMIGPRDRRPPTGGTWYPWSSNGWGIIDFLAFCRAAGFEAVPAFNMGETPDDMADFIRYVNGAETSPWGRRRIEDGYGAAFGLRYVQLGNEERVDAGYAARFNALADAIWASDPNITIVVGDFAYGDPIADPDQFTGAASGIRSMDGHRRILSHARAAGRRVWFDVHIGTDGPGRSRDLDALPSYVAALGRLAEGVDHRVVVFEFNAGNHQQRRALANATAIAEIARMRGAVAIACSANCLQVDGQNDNDWDQGLLFMNPSSVWLQPPGWVARMVARAFQPNLVGLSVEGGAPGLDVTALRSDDGQSLTLLLVNPGAHAITLTASLDGFAVRAPVAVESLSAPLDACNTAAAPLNVRPTKSVWPEQGRSPLTFRPHTFAVVQFRSAGPSTRP